MSEWAEKLAKERKSAREAEQIKTQKILSDRQLVHAKQDDMWVQIRKRVAELVKELNEAMGEESLSVAGAADHNKITIRVPDQGSGNDLIFNPKDGLMKVNFHGAELKLFVNSRDEVLWRSTATGDGIWTSDEVAKNAVETAWRYLVK